MTRYKCTPEGMVQSAILDYLAAERIWHRRMNTRVVDVVGRGGKMRPMFFGSPGMADILATPVVKSDPENYPSPLPLWIECKAPGGKQSEAQKAFQQEVTAAGHDYLLAYSIYDVRQWLEINR